MEELFWLGMGYDSDDGEKDDSFDPSKDYSEVSEAESVDREEE